MRFHSADFLQRDFPGGQRGILQELCKLFVRDRLDFRAEERSGFADFREEILQLPHAREVFGVRAVLRELKRSVVVNALDFLIERFLEFQTSGKRNG